MTKLQYIYFKRAVQTFLDENQVAPSLHGPIYEPPEPYFSGRACGCCKSPLGGNRETYNFFGGLGKFQADICEDCVYYLAYGRLDDSTMADMD